MKKLQLHLGTRKIPMIFLLFTICKYLFKPRQLLQNSSNKFRKYQRNRAPLSELSKIIQNVLGPQSRKKNISCNNLVRFVQKTNCLQEFCETANPLKIPASQYICCKILTSNTFPHFTSVPLFPPSPTDKIINPPSPSWCSAEQNSSSFCLKTFFQLPVCLL